MANDVMVDGKAAQAEIEARELEELDRQIKAEQAAIAEVEKRRAASKAEAKKAELEQLQRARREAEIVEQLELKHGKVNEKIVTCSLPEGLVAVRAPLPMVYRKFLQATTGKNGATLDDQDLLVRQCLIHPSQDEFNVIKQQRPGIVTTLSNLAMKLAGVMQVELEGK